MINRRLRPFQTGDFEPFHAMASDYEVVKMLGSWPFPAEPGFTRARMFAPEAKAGLVRVIEVEGAFAGTIGGVNGGIGYALERKYWGRGFSSTKSGQIKVLSPRSACMTAR